MEQSERIQVFKNEPPASIEIRATSGEVLGKLWLDGPELRFEGKADEAAREFFDFLLGLWNDRGDELLTKLCERWEDQTVNWDNGHLPLSDYGKGCTEMLRDCARQLREVLEGAKG